MVWSWTGVGCVWIIPSPNAPTLPPRGFTWEGPHVLRMTDMTMTRATMRRTVTMMTTTVVAVVAVAEAAAAAAAAGVMVSESSLHT